MRQADVTAKRERDPGSGTGSEAWGEVRGGGTTCSEPHMSVQIQLRHSKMANVANQRVPWPANSGTRVNLRINLLSLLALSAGWLLVAPVCAQAARPPPPPPDVAQSGLTGTGQPPTDYAAGAAVIPAMSIQTFTGVSGNAALQNIKQRAITPPGFAKSYAYQADAFTITKPFIGNIKWLPGTTIPFGTTVNAADQVLETWGGKSILIAKAPVAYSLTTEDGAKGLTDLAIGAYYSGGAPTAPAGETLVARTLISKTAPANTRSGARSVDPYPVAATSLADDETLPYQQYPYAANIGGTNSLYTDSSGNPVETPTMLSVNGTDQLATMEYFADDSNDPTFATTQSNPIWDFSISLDTFNGAPELLAAFTYDSSRLTLSGSSRTGSALLANLLSQTGVTYTTDLDSAVLTIPNSVQLFSGSYTAYLTPTSADPEASTDIDFSFGTAAASLVPEPCTGSLALLSGSVLLLLRRGRWRSFS
jgi:hypothetical protein